MEDLDEADLTLIASAHFRALPPALLSRMIGFTRALQVAEGGLHGTPPPAAP